MRTPAVFRLAKEGSSWAEYEDAVAWNSRRKRFAVADGASASAFARLWARLLADAYARGRLSADTMESDLEPLQAHWSARVEQRQLPWYAVEQARRGAFAALVGLTLNETGEWCALAVGDCCLFQVRDEVLIAALPIWDAAEFDNRPLLIGSRPSANVPLREQHGLVTAAGTWRAGDVFLLMSDALAATFLGGCASNGHSPLAVLEFDRTASGFRNWVKHQRVQRTLRNDDVSLLWLSIPADATA